ncbi:hypothetical protein TNCV_3303851 [Trichonephila clavipes]|nr:hypothetical protein TNCV_3303851 [Trichonephila clavipes]
MWGSRQHFYTTWSLAEGVADRSTWQFHCRSASRRRVIRFFVFIACKCSMLTVVYRRNGSTKGQSASSREEFLDELPDLSSSHKRQPLDVIEGIAMGKMASIQCWYRNFCKEKANHCPPFLLERSPTLQQLRGETNDTLHISVVDYPSFNAGY